MGFSNGFGYGVRFGSLIAACALVASCGPGFSALRSKQILSSDTSISFQIPANPSERLSQSLLSGMTVGNGVALTNFWEYSPRYPLYSHGSSKRRWVYLPTSSKINNTDPDAWVFPTGTVFMKEFALDGRKIETRVFEKIRNGTGSSAWRSSVYLWRSDQVDADLLNDDLFYSRPTSEQNQYQAGLFRDRYQIVAPSQCLRCHSSSADTALGFNYLQLSNQFLNRNVLALSDAGWLTNSVSRFDEILGSDGQKNAIGYMQTNCVSCHAGNGPGPHNFKHLSTVTRIEDEAIFRSMATSPGLITPGQPATSRLYQRFANGTMPPGTISPDTFGQNVIREWIEGL